MLVVIDCLVVSVGRENIDKNKTAGLPSFFGPSRSCLSVSPRAR
jgi:hypothetical protein